MAIILRTFFIWITSKADYQNSTYVAKHIMVPITILNVIIYVFMPLVATWDWSRTEIGKLSGDQNLNEGVYPDFNANWFLDSGAMIMQTMSFNIVMPLIEFGMFWVIRYL